MPTLISGKNVLGVSTAIPKKYSPSTLQRVERIRPGNSSPKGFDVWHLYEVSFLNDKGTPIFCKGKLIYSCDNPWLVESKSLKLYLASLNMEQLSFTEAKTRITTDLSKLLETSVNCQLFQTNTTYFSFLDYTPISSNSITCDEYQEDPTLLLPETSNKPLKISTNLLRSNCPVTNQPDWGSVYLHLEGETQPTPESFLKYIVSFRDENHFHEEICERIFQSLNEKFSPKKLAVTCLYERRGGIDICPTRATHKELFEKVLIDNSPF